MNVNIDIITPVEILNLSLLKKPTTYQQNQSTASRLELDIFDNKLGAPRLQFISTQAPSVLFRLFRPRPDASSSAAAAAADAAWRRGGAVLDLRPEAPPPPPTAAIKDTETATALPVRTLRDYQVAGVGWLIANHAAGRGCILADEMGLGKTAQACRAVAAALAGGAQPNAAALIVAPLSTIEQWRRELNAWTPALEVCIYHDATARGRDLIRHFEWGDCSAPKFDVVVATYETISSDGMLLSRCGADWYVAIIVTALQKTQPT